MIELAQKQGGYKRGSVEKKDKQGAGPLPEMGCDESEKTLGLGVRLPGDREGEGERGGEGGVSGCRFVLELNLVA